MKSLLVLGLALSTFAFGNESTYSDGKMVEGKYYPHLEAIHVKQSGIFVDFEGEEHRVDGLHSDGRGIYVVRMPVNEWRCSKGHANPPWAERCLTCRE